MTRDSDEWSTVQLDRATQPKPGNVARIILYRVKSMWTLDHLVIERAAAIPHKVPSATLK
jgi:hypothetical protein